MAQYAKTETVTLAFEAREGDDHGCAYYPTLLTWAGTPLHQQGFCLVGSGYEYRLYVQPSRAGIPAKVLEALVAAGAKIADTDPLTAATDDRQIRAAEERRRIAALVDGAKAKGYGRLDAVSAPARYSLPDGSTALLTLPQARRVWQAWRAVAAVALRRGEGVQIAVGAGVAIDADPFEEAPEIEVTTVYAPQYEAVLIVVGPDGVAGWASEQDAPDVDCPCGPDAPPPPPGPWECLRTAE